MSNIVLGAVWQLQMPPTQKFVLVSLADQANDDGLCWPSVGSIVLRTGFKERAIRSAIKWLEVCGYLRRNVRSGRATYYSLTPALGAPLHQVHPALNAPTPAPDAPTPAFNAPTPAFNAPTPAPRAGHITIINHQGTKIASPDGDAGVVDSENPRDLVWETTLQVCGLDGGTPTDRERKAWNGAVKSLKSAGATPGEIRARARCYRARWPEVSLTPTALARRWTECVAELAT